MKCRNIILIVLCLLLWSACAVAEESKVIMQYKKALASDPGNIEIRYLLGIAQLKARDYQSAVENLKTVYEAGKEDARLVFSIGFAYQNLGLSEDAFAYYQKSKKMIGAASASGGGLKEELSAGFFNLGMEYHEKKELDKAVLNYQESLELSPQDGTGYCLVGVVYYQKKEYQQSLPNFESCLKGSKENAWARDYIISMYEMKGLEYIKSKEYKKAAAEFDTILQMAADYEKARYYKCYIGYIDGDIYNARSCLAKLKNTKDRQVQEAAGIVLFNIGVVLQDNGDWNGSISALKDAILFRHGDAEQRLYLARAHLETKEYDNALREFQAASMLAPDNKDAEAGIAIASDKAVRIHLRSAQENLNAREFQMAINEFDKVIGIEPNHKEAFLGKERAEAELRAILIQTEKKKQSAIAQHLKIAREAFERNDYNKSIAAYAQALKLDKDNKDALNGIQKAKTIKSQTIDKNMQLGKDAYEAKKYYQDICYFNILLNVEPGHNEAKTFLHGSRKAMNAAVVPLIKAGEDLYKNGDSEGSAAQFKKVLNIEPDNVAAKSYLLRLDDIFAKKAVEKEVQRLYLKGIDLYTKGSYADAITLWEDILKIEPRHEKAILNIQKAKRMIKSTGAISGVRG